MSPSVMLILLLKYIAQRKEQLDCVLSATYKITNTKQTLDQTIAKCTTSRVFFV